MGSFNEDKRLDNLLETVLDSTESFLSVAFMIADHNVVRDELKSFLEGGARSERGVLAQTCQSLQSQVARSPKWRHHHLPARKDDHALTSCLEAHILYDRILAKAL